jgi:hypothetical protein
MTIVVITGAGVMAIEVGDMAATAMAAAGIVVDITAINQQY